MNPTHHDVTPEALALLTSDLSRVKEAVHRNVVGHNDVLEAMLIALLAEGHVLLEGVPGVGKTMLVRCLGSALSLRTSRIQFTPDLMPADILGTTLILEEPNTGSHRLEFRPGPIFANLVLADEVNRATPKTQSALLEAMQERTVTTLDRTHPLEAPFCVLATQNPIEMEGTYPLPEAQLDRFMMKLEVPFPNANELSQILRRTAHPPDTPIEPVLDRARLLEMQSMVRHLPVADHVIDTVVRLVRATHPELKEAHPHVKRYVRLGASPRGAQSLLLAAKLRACLNGELVASIRDVCAMARPTLCHRLLLSFEGQADGVTTEQLIDELVASTT